MPRKTTTNTTNNKESMIQQCIDLIRSFNPILHSIDTHVAERLGSIDLQSSAEHVFIQQVVYGWYKERDTLQALIHNYYADNSASVSRKDMIMYQIFGYLAMFRLHELGFPRFKELTKTQEPTKMYNFVMYLFNMENLHGCLRTDWMKLRDLTYVEDELIAGMERYVPDGIKLCNELQVQAVGNATAQAAKEELKKTGMAGVSPVVKVSTTVPISPRMNKPRPPKLPEPERIPTQLVAHDVPDHLNKINLEWLNKQRNEERQHQRDIIQTKYPEKLQFKFQELKSSRRMEDIRREVQEAQTKDLDFNASYFHEPPDFSKIPAKVRLNASAIYREDALFRKQQAKDAQLLKQYEEELHDQTEFLIWQKDMKEKDKVAQMDLVEKRKEAIVQSHITTAEAIAKQKQDNHVAASVLREEAEVIKLVKEMEHEKYVLRNQELAQNVAEIRDLRPKLAVEKVWEDHASIAQELRKELEYARRMKEKDDRIEEEIRADKIRMLRAENEVLKKQITIFDPTEIKGAGFLDEMSYLEMKIRLSNEKERAERDEHDRRERIFMDKEKRTKDLEERTKAVMKVRQTKAETNKSNRQKKIETEMQEQQTHEQKQQKAAIKLEAELREKREEKHREAAALRMEEDRVRRQQLYLGAAAGAVEETNETQWLKAKERILRTTQHTAKDEAQLLEQTLHQAKLNRLNQANKSNIAHERQMLLQDKMALEEKKRAVGKLREEVLMKRSMALMGQHQHELTKTATIVHNPYANAINEYSITHARLHKGTVLPLTPSPTRK